MNVDPLHYVFVDELKGIYAAELQLDGVLQQMARAAASDLLRTIIEEHQMGTPLLGLASNAWELTRLPVEDRRFVAFPRPSHRLLHRPA